MVATAGCSFTLVIPALPAIAAVTGAGYATATWILTGYLLASSVTTPVLGRLGDVLGRRRILGWTLSVTLCGMVVGSLAADAETLIVARILVGCGGGALPLAMGIAYDEVPTRVLSRTIGLLAAFSGLGSVVGLLLSAELMHAFGFRSLFWFPSIFILVAGCLAVRDARRARMSRPSSRRDGLSVGWTEHLLLAVWLTLPLVLLSSVPLSPSMGSVVLLLAITVLAHVAWRWLHRRSAVGGPQSRSMTLILGNVIGTALAAGLFGSYALLPLFALHERRDSGEPSVLEATYFLLPFEVGFLTASAFGGVLSRAAPRAPIVIGGLLAAVSFAGLAVRSEGAVGLGATGLLGGALGLAYPALALLILQAAPALNVGSSLAFNTNLRTVGGALGTQLVAALTNDASVAGGPPRGASIASAVLGVLVATGGGLGLLLPRLADRRRPTSLSRRFDQ